MCSLNCVHTLQRRLVAYFPSLFSGTQILAWKGAKDFSIQFFSTVLHFSNIGTEEEEYVFFFLLSFFALLGEEEQPKQGLSEI